MKIQIKRASAHDFDAPTLATAGAAAYDLRAVGDHFLPAGQVTMIPTGFCWAIPSGWCGLILPRSGLAAKHNITVANAPGLIDSDYRGEVCVLLTNRNLPYQDGKANYRVAHGDRIAQLMVTPIAWNEPLKIVSELDDTDRGDGGFGSTGVE